MDFISVVLNLLIYRMKFQSELWYMHELFTQSVKYVFWYFLPKVHYLISNPGLYITKQEDLSLSCDVRSRN
jgi:hypothetical protein